MPSANKIPRRISDLLDAPERFAPRALPQGVVGVQAFIFATVKPDDSYVPKVTLVNDGDAELEDIHYMVTGVTPTGFNIVLFNDLPTANYSLKVEA